MRWLIISTFALAGCGSVDVTPDPPQSSHNPCVTSLGCPAGERCDEGQCAADVDCPGPSAPRVLYENADDISHPYIALMNGREYLDRQLGKDVPGADTTFIDLATGTTTALHHAPGSAGCIGDPAWCMLTTTAGTSSLLTDVTLDAATNLWSAAASHELPAGYYPMGQRTPLGEEMVLFGHGKPDLQSFNMATGQSESLLDLGGRSPSRILQLPSGPTLLAFTNSSKNGAELSFAPLLPGAPWTSIFTLPEAFKTSGIALPAANEWFIVADLMPSAIQHVWRVSPTSKIDVGASEDPLLPEVASRVWRGESRLEGTRGNGLVCDGDTCHSGQLDLATLVRTPLGSVTFPGATRLSVQQERWLACGVVDALISEPIFPGGDPTAKAVGYRVHAVRVLPDAVP